MADDELRKLIESNTRAVQAMLDARAEDRLKFQAFQQRTEVTVSGLQDVTVRLANLQKDIDRLLDRYAQANDA